MVGGFSIVRKLTCAGKSRKARSGTSKAGGGWTERKGHRDHLKRERIWRLLKPEKEERGVASGQGRRIQSLESRGEPPRRVQKIRKINTFPRGRLKGHHAKDQKTPFSTRKELPRGIYTTL